MGYVVPLKRLPSNCRKCPCVREDTIHRIWSCKVLNIKLSPGYIIGDQRPARCPIREEVQDNVRPD